jgi:hypothetical protein
MRIGGYAVCLGEISGHDTYYSSFSCFALDQELPLVAGLAFAALRLAVSTVPVHAQTPSVLPFPQVCPLISAAPIKVRPSAGEVHQSRMAAERALRYAKAHDASYVFFEPTHRVHTAQSDG